MTKLPTLAPILSLVVLLALNGRSVMPVYACSALFPPIDYEVRNADAVALVRAVSVGGSENTAPPVTPAPGLLRDPNGRGSKIISLEGIGATLEVEELLAGGMPSPVRVDQARREYIERGIRTLEANPSYAFPCELDFVLQRWTADARYVVFLTREADGRWNSSARYQVAGADVVLGSGNRHPPLSMSEAVYDAHFAGIPAEEPQEGWYEGTLMREIDAPVAPLEPLLAAIRGIAGGQYPLLPSPVEQEVREPPSREEQQGRITAPTTGDAGLR